MAKSNAFLEKTMARNTIMKKILCTALVATSAFASVATLTACETSNPEVSMTVTFNGKEYELNYKLYRKLAPTTTTHFLELVDAGYYNGLCVHDYSANEWVTGAYTFDATKTDEGGLTYKDYFAIAPTLDLTATVWKDRERTTPTYTVYGEFSKNNFEVENGKITNSYGSLTMKYFDIGKVYDSVWCEKSSEGETKRDYQYNSATSVFSMNLSTSGATYSQYCTFANLLKDEDKTELEKLASAVKAYIEDNGDEEDFAPEVTEVTTNTGDPFAIDFDETFNVPVQPIVIKEMKVTKW